MELERQKLNKKSKKEKFHYVLVVTFYPTEKFVILDYVVDKWDALNSRGMLNHLRTK